MTETPQDPHQQPVPAGPPQVPHQNQAAYPPPQAQYPQAPQGPHPQVPVGPPAAPEPPRKNFFARHKVLTVVGAVVAVFLIAQVANGGSAPDDVASGGGEAAVASGDQGNEPASAEQESPDDDAAGGEEPTAEAPAGEPETAGVGDAVRDGKFEFTVTEVETGVPSVGDEMFGQTAQGQYVLVHLTVENIGDEAQYFDGSSQELVDTAGRKHSADSSAAIYLDDSNSFLNQINPGNSVEGIVVFDVPADAELASITLHDSMFSGGVTVALG